MQPVTGREVRMVESQMLLNRIIGGNLSEEFMYEHKH